MELVFVDLLVIDRVVLIGNKEEGKTVEFKAYHRVQDAC